MGFQKYDKEKEAEYGYGRLCLYIRLEAIEKVKKLQKVLEDDDGSPLPKARVVDQAIDDLYRKVIGKK